MREYHAKTLSAIKHMADEQNAFSWMPRHRPQHPPFAHLTLSDTWRATDCQHLQPTLVERLHVLHPRVYHVKPARVEFHLRLDVPFQDKQEVMKAIGCHHNMRLAQRFIRYCRMIGRNFSIEAALSVASCIAFRQQVFILSMSPSCRYSPASIAQSCTPGKADLTSPFPTYSSFSFTRSLSLTCVLPGHSHEMQPRPVSAAVLLYSKAHLPTMSV